MARNKPIKPPTNSEISTKLSQLAQLLQNQGENRFKVKAYRSAAEALKKYPRQVADLIAEEEDLTVIPGIGKGISAAITEIVESGTLSKVETMVEGLPKGALEVSQETGLNIKDATRIVKKLEVSSVEHLKRALEEGKVKDLFGVRMEFKIRLGLNNIKRVLWWEAEDEAIAFKAFIEGIAGVKRCEVAGSFRRRRETVGSLRFVVECSSPAGVLKSLEGHAAVEKIIEKKKERVAFRLASGPQLVVRFAEKASWGDSMIAETGSLAHVEAVEKSSGAALRRKKFRSEEEWYAARDLQFFEPELREGRGENEFDIGELVTLDDIKGDLHMHTTASDGVNTIPEMAAAAKKRGYSYIAISDHSRSLKITNGLDIKRLRKQIAEIKEFNSTSKGLHVFAASEVDILEDGELDYPDEVLSELDIVICSIHSRFNLDKKKQTARVVKAMSNRYATFLGHMTGRLLLRRPGYELDTDLILKTIHDNGKYVEINSSPDRLDIDDSTAIEARKMGLPIVVNTDAHSIRELDFMKLGVQQARRGWQRASDVLNTLPLAKLKKRLNDVRG